jgi:hypothetical protein
MREKRLKLSVILLFALGLTGLQAQESINSAGGNATGSGGSSSYSVGQAACQIHTATNGSVTEGVQQPYEISVVTAIKDARGINLSVSAYPNPTTDHLILEVQDFDLSNLKYQLYDVNGRLLQSKNITVNRSNIAMGNLMPGNYFLKVIHNNIEVKAFNIIKSR